MKIWPMLVLLLLVVVAGFAWLLRRPTPPDVPPVAGALRIETPAQVASAEVEPGDQRLPAASEPAQAASSAAAPLAPVAGPALWGHVSVDGERRIPANFAMVLDSVIAHPELDMATATYTVPLQVGKLSKVVVSSDESMLANLAAPPAGPDGKRQLDLALVSGRILYVHAIDAQSGGAAADFTLTLELSILQETTVQMRSYRSQKLTGKTDARGDCTFRGLPQEGRATLRDPQKRGAADKPLLELRLTPDSPAEFRETVNVNAIPATVAGTLPPGGDLLRVQRARIGEAGRTLPVEEALAADASGSWVFECEVPSDWRLWLSRDGARASRIEEVHVTEARRYGPIELALEEASRLQLHLVNAPPSGSVSISIVEDAGDPYRYEDVPITAREMDHELALHGPARLTLRCRAGKELTVAESRQLLRVDPAQTPQITVDLHGDRVHGVTLRVNGESPPGETVLPFIGLDAAGKPTMEGVIFHLVDGKSRNPVPVLPGTYLYVLQSDTLRGAIYGAVHVPDSAQPAELRLEWSGTALPRASLGTGIEFESIEDVSGASWSEGLRRVRWPKNWGPEVDTLLVPTNAKYRVLD
jgi:hypothetical protein